MPRFLFAAALLFVSAPLLAQSVPTEAAVPALRTQTSASDRSLASVDMDALSETELARRVAHLYQRHADLLLAAAAGEDSRYSSLLEGLVGDLELLAQRPGMLYEPRFRELYASVLTEKELFYGTETLDRGDIYAVNEEAFRMIYETDEPTLASVQIPVIVRTARIAEATIPMEVTPSVESSLRYLLRRPSHVATLRQRADTYFPMVERIMAEEGVPDELKYLAMVESALNPVARSHMAAAGMWQFIRATGGAYGLQANGDIDHRLDPELSTRAAARHLRDLYDRFGDWQLALAGYNCNPAVIARAVRRFEAKTGERATFWDIDHEIPRETRGYVPMFIATSLILSNPDAYGFEAPEPGPTYAFDRVPVAPGTRLSDVSRTIDVDEAVLRALNPMLRRGQVPSTRMPHTIRIPLGFYEQHAAQLDRLASPEAEGMNLTAETVSFGPRAMRPLASEEPAEILIAAREAATPETGRRTLTARNGLPTRPPLPPAQFERPERVAAAVPVVSEAIAATQPETEAVPKASEIAEPVAIVESPRVAASPAAQEAEPLAAAEPALEEALEEVAAPEAAPALEPVAEAVAEPVTQPVAPEAVPEAAAPAPPVRLAADSRSARPTTHRVQRGEHLTMLARQYGVRVDDLRGWNSLSTDVIRVGQRLRLTAPDGYNPRAARAARTRTANATRTTTHRVARGENLTQIARKYGVSLSDLRRWNSLSGDTIRPGQSLKIERRGVRG